MCSVMLILGEFLKMCLIKKQFEVIYIEGIMTSHSHFIFTFTSLFCVSCVFKSFERRLWSYCWVSWSLFCKEKNSTKFKKIKFQLF
jgi:hypothetical protein